MNDKEFKYSDNNVRYNSETEDKLIEVMENCRKERRRVRIFYGSNGKVWNEEYNVIGYIGCTGGTRHIPILLPYAKSKLGSSILDRCIVRLIDVKTKEILYQKNNVVFPEHEIRKIDGLPQYALYIDGKFYTFFATEEKARHFSDFLLGKRNSK